MIFYSIKPTMASFIQFNVSVLESGGKLQSMVFTGWQQSCFQLDNKRAWDWMEGFTKN